MEGKGSFQELCRCRGPQGRGRSRTEDEGAIPEDEDNSAAPGLKRRRDWFGHKECEFGVKHVNEAHVESSEWP